MKKRYKLFVTACILSMTFLSGCGKDKEEQPLDIVFEAGDKEEQPLTIVFEARDKEEQPLAIVFEARDMEGNTVTESVFSQSKITMVNVWATYCNPCLSEMPGLGELAKEYDPEEFKVIGIISDVQEGAGEETVRYAADLIQMTGADYSHLLLNESLYNALLGEVYAVPTTFFINEEGEIVDTVIGAMEKTAWEERIDALLEQ